MKIFAQKLLVGRTFLANQTVTVEDGQITAIGGGGPADFSVWALTPGLVDLHCHGGQGFDPELNERPLPEFLTILLCHGVTDVLLTLGAEPLPTMRRIEQEGYVRARKGLLSSTSANDYLNALHAREQKYPAYMAVLQLGERKPSPSEEKYLAAWVDMGFPAETVALAYDKTVLRCHEFKWAYCNGILKRWHEKGLHTPAETAAENAAPKKEEKPSGGKNDWMKQYL